MMHTSRIRVALAGLGLVCVASTAQAQEMNFAGTTAGCFYMVTVCAPTELAATVGGMTYTAANIPQFQGLTDATGFLGIGGQDANFGMFSLTNEAFNYNGWNFVLAVMFSAPPGVSTTNAAWLQGKVNTSSGGVTVHFDPEPTHLVALDGTEFDLHINDVSVSRGTVADPGVNYVSGDVQVTATPEPATVGLVLTGLVGLIPMYRRRKTAV